MSSTSWNNGNSGYATSIVKRNSSGTVQWERCWYIDPSIHGYTGGSTVSSALQILFDADDNVYLCMRQGTNSNYDRPILIFSISICYYRFRDSLLFLALLVFLFTGYPVKTSVIAYGL